MWNNEYVKCPTSCSDDTPFTECACSCPTLDFEDLGFMDIMTILEDVGIDIYLRPSGAQGGPTAMQDSVVEEVSIAEMARQAAVRLAKLEPDTFGIELSKQRPELFALAQLDVAQPAAAQTTSGSQSATGVAAQAGQDVSAGTGATEGASTTTEGGQSATATGIEGGQSATATASEGGQSATATGIEGGQSATATASEGDQSATATGIEGGQSATATTEGGQSATATASEGGQIASTTTEGDQSATATASEGGQIASTTTEGSQSATATGTSGGGQSSSSATGGGGSQAGGGASGSVASTGASASSTWLDVLSSRQIKNYFDWLIKFSCHPGKLGAMATGASSNDPVFWCGARRRAGRPSFARLR